MTDYLQETVTYARQVVGLWNAGRNTAEIARRMGEDEASIYNALPSLRQIEQDANSVIAKRGRYTQNECAHVFHLYDQGKTNSEIAEAVNRSVKSVDRFLRERGHAPHIEPVRRLA